MINKYNRTQFIKISNNNDHSDFYIDVTTMQNARLRISALKAQYKNYLATGKYWKEVFKFFKYDWSFYVMEKGCYEDYDAIKERKNQLIEMQNLKYKKIERLVQILEN